MRLKMNGFWSTALLVVLAAGLSAQTPTQPPAQPPASATTTQQKPTFRVQVDLVTNDIVVRDDKGGLRPKDPNLLLDAWHEQCHGASDG
jgi:hypothetical protein